MAKTTAPLLSLGASGSIGNQITFATKQRTRYAKTYRNPEQPESAAQDHQKQNWRSCAAFWSTFSPLEAMQQSWYLYAKLRRTKNSGYGEYIRASFQQQPDNHITVIAKAFTIAGRNKIRITVANPFGLALSPLGETYDIYCGASCCNIFHAGNTVRRGSRLTFTVADFATTCPFFYVAHQLLPICGFMNYNEI